MEGPTRLWFARGLKDSWGGEGEVGVSDSPDIEWRWNREFRTWVRCPRSRESWSVCYSVFLKLTGIDLKPGEMTCLELREVFP